MGLEHLVFMADLYKERYGAKYLGWPAVRYLYTRTRVLKIICCLMGSQCPKAGCDVSVLRSTGDKSILNILEPGSITG